MDQSPEAEVLKKLLRLKINGVTSQTRIRELSAKKIVGILYALAEKWDIQCCKPNCKKIKEKFTCIKTALRMMDFSHMTPTIRQIKGVQTEKKSLKFIVRVLENVVDKLEQRYPDLYAKRDWPKYPKEIEIPPESPQFNRKQSAYKLPEDLDIMAVPETKVLPSNNTSFKITSTANISNSGPFNSTLNPTQTQPKLSNAMQIENESKESSEKDLPTSQASFKQSSVFHKPHSKSKTENSMKIESPVKTISKKDPSRGLTPSPVPGLFFENTSPMMSLPAGFKSTRHSLTLNTTTKSNSSTESASNPPAKAQQSLHKTTQKLKRFNLGEEKESLFNKKKNFERSVGEKRPREEDGIPKRKRQLIDRTESKISPRKSNLFRTEASIEKNVNPDFAEALNDLSNSDFTSQTIELSGIDKRLLRSHFGGEVKRIFGLIFARLQDYGVQNVSSHGRLLWKIQKPIPQERWMKVLAAVRLGIAKIRECMPDQLDIETKMLVWSSEKNIRINDSEF